MRTWIAAISEEIKGSIGGNQYARGGGGAKGGGGGAKGGGGGAKAAGKKDAVKVDERAFDEVSATFLCACVWKVHKEPFVLCVTRERTSFVRS